MDNSTENLIMYVDDAEYAWRVMAPMIQAGRPTRWILVSCPPRLSRRVGRWLSHTARKNWREKWTDTLCSKLEERLQAAAGGTVVRQIAVDPLPDFTRKLQQRFGVARVVDARRPKFGTDMGQVTESQPAKGDSWQLPAAVGSLGAALIIAAE